MPGTKSENDRGLFLIYKSNNAHNYVNYIGTNMAALLEFTSHPKVKKELVDTLRQLADNIEKNY